MDRENFKKHLKILGIYRYSQLKKGSLDEYWKLQYYKIRNSTAEEQRKNDLLIRLNNAKRVLSNFTEEEIHSLLKGADKQIFERSSIINFPSIKNEIYQKINLSNFANHLTKSSNYTSIPSTYLDDGKYWEIGNLSDFIHLRDDILNIPKQKSFRTIEEFTYLLDFIHTEKIKLFIGRDIQDPQDKGYGAKMYLGNNTLVINYDSIFDVDWMCRCLTHELIHYLQQGKPLGIDIEDSIMDKDYLSYYDTNIGDSLREELEASTFEFFPYFIKKYKLNKSQFLISPQRDWTIDWICQNKKLPNYPSHPSSIEERILKYDFAKGETKEIKPINNETKGEIDSSNDYSLIGLLYLMFFRN